MCRERTSGIAMSTLVPMRASKGKFAVDKLLSFLEECGSESGNIAVETLVLSERQCKPGEIRLTAAR